MKQEERKVLIPLAAAHVNQYTKESVGKSDWEVQENVTNKILATLPKNIDDATMFKVLHFARDFELKAFNIGMKHMGRELFGQWNKEKSNLMRVIKELETANSKLAEKLEKFIGMEA